MKSVSWLLCAVTALAACTSDKTKDMPPPKPEPPQTEPPQAAPPETDPPGTEPPGSAGTATLGEANAAFAIDAYKQLAEEPGNLAISPVSISIALAMTYAGARDGTAAEMAKTLHFADVPDSGPESATFHQGFRDLMATLHKASGKDKVELHMANRLWGQTGATVVPGFSKISEDNYGADLALVDFTRDADKARTTINKWVSEQTKGKIEELLPKGSLDAMTRMVLTNAVYFKGMWSDEFDAKKTVKADFHLAGGKTVKADMMSRTAQYAFADSGDVMVLELPYKGDDVAMVVVLPKSQDGLAKLEQELSPAALDTWLSAMRKQEVNVSLPRFEARSGIELSEMFGELGMKQPFSDSDANFAGINGDPKDLYISAIYHQAYVKVDEAGTTAAAATAVVMTTRGRPPAAPQFRADHPFMYMLREKSTGTILFLGRVVDPEAG